MTTKIPVETVLETLEELKVTIWNKLMLERRNSCNDYEDWDWVDLEDIEDILAESFVEVEDRFKFLLSRAEDG